MKAIAPLAGKRPTHSSTNGVTVKQTVIKARRVRATDGLRIRRRMVHGARAGVTYVASKSPGLEVASYPFFVSCRPPWPPCRRLPR